jgi:hypothetical protein
VKLRLRNLLNEEKSIRIDQERIVMAMADVPEAIAIADGHSVCHNYLVDFHFIRAGVREKLKVKS